MRKSLFCCWAVAIPLSGMGQGMRVNGRVLDAETGAPLPFANLQIENTRLGTSTNVEGYFSLFVPGEAKKLNLVISYIGYQRYKVAAQQVPGTVRLIPESRQLKEFVVMPDSSLFVFLREAYRSIEKNYPTEIYQLKGFYRESLKLTDGPYFYFGEAELVAQGSGYQFSAENGSVKVLKSRINHFVPADSIRSVLYYGGPFIAIAADPVKVRLDGLRPDKKDYDYQLTGIEKNLGNEVWEVSFKKKDNSIRGKLYIEKDSKAYIRTEVTRFYKDSAERTLSGVQDIQTTVRNSYIKGGDHWFLAYIGIQKKQFNRQLNKRTTIAAEFSTQEILSDTLTEISFKDELEYTGIFSQLQDNFDENFWEGSSLLVPDSSLQAQIKPMLEGNESGHLPGVDSQQTIKTLDNRKKGFVKLQRKLAFFTRIGTRLGLQLSPFSVQGADLLLQYAGLNQPLSFTVPLGSREFPLLLSQEITFRVKKRLHVVWPVAVDLSRDYEFGGTGIGARYAFKLNKRGNPLMLRPSLVYGFMWMGMGAQIFDNPGDLIFDGEAVTDDRLRFYLGERTRYFRPSFSLEKKLGGLRWLYLEVGYFMNFSQLNMLYLRDASGFFRQNRGVPLESTEVVVTQNGERITSQPFNWFNSLFLEAGFRWRF